MGKTRNPANKGKGKAIKPTFGNIGGAAAVLVASSKKRNIATAMWYLLPSAGAKGSFVVQVQLPGFPQQQHTCPSLATAQACYNGHGRRVPIGQLPAGCGLVAAPAPAPKANAAQGSQGS
jgi:hypothetical protein